MNEMDEVREELLGEIARTKEELTNSVDMDSLVARLNFNEHENTILRERLKQARADASESRARIERLEAELGLGPFKGGPENPSSWSRRRTTAKPKTPYDARVEHEQRSKARPESKWTQAASKVKAHVREKVQKTAIGELRDLVRSIGEKVATAGSRVAEIGKEVNERVDGLGSETYALARELARHEQNYRFFTKRNKELFSRLVENQISAHSAGGRNATDGRADATSEPARPQRPSPRPQTAGPIARRAFLSRRPQSARTQNRNARRPKSARLAADTTFEDMLALRRELQDSPRAERVAARSRPTSRARRPQSAR